MKTRRTSYFLRIAAFLFAAAVATISLKAFAMDLNDGFFSEQPTHCQLSPEDFFLKACEVLQRVSKTASGDDWKYWKRHYQDKLKTHDDAVVAIDSVLACLFSAKSHVIRIFAGYSHLPVTTRIGIQLALDERGRVFIRAVQPSKTTAGMLNLFPGDVIEEINGEPVYPYNVNLKKIADKLAGQADSEIALRLCRNGTSIKVYVRRQFRCEDICGMLENNVGYLSLDSHILLNSTGVNDLLQCVKHARAFIIDFRDSSSFCTFSRVQEIANNLLKCTSNRPFVILVNNGTSGSTLHICKILRKGRHTFLVGEPTQAMQNIRSFLYRLDGDFHLEFETVRTADLDDLPALERLVPDYTVKLSHSDHKDSRGPWWYSQRELPTTQASTEDVQLNSAIKLLNNALAN